MPYTISKIIIVSTATKEDIALSEEDKANNNSIWNFNIIQNNDVYISFEKQEGNIRKNEKIKNITINNIQYIESPKVGELQAYMPNSGDGNRFVYNDEYKVSEKLSYRGADEGSYKDLLVNSNGGNIAISFANKGIGKYSSTAEDTEIVSNGKILSKVGISDEQVKSKVRFDLTIELNDGKRYIGTVELDINCANLVESENGTSTIELTDFGSVIFKRI